MRGIFKLILKKILKQKYIILFLFYLLLLFYWMTLGFGRYSHNDYMYNLKPFHTIKQYLHFENYNIKTWIVNLIGNIGVFVPFGILIPRVFRSKLLKSIIIFEVGLATLELIQLVTKRGSLDIDDFILNTLGFLAGYILYRFISRSMYNV